MQDNSKHARFRRSVEEYKQLLIDNYYRVKERKIDTKDCETKIISYYVLCVKEYSESELLLFVLRTMSILIKPRGDYFCDPFALNVFVTQKAHELIGELEA